MLYKSTVLPCFVVLTLVGLRGGKASPHCHCLLICRAGFGAEASCLLRMR